MHRIKTFILVFLGGFIGAGFCAAAADPFGCAPSFAKASAGRQDRRAPSAMISSARVPFVANEGQLANPDVKYYARTFGGTVYALSGGKIVYSLPKYESGKMAGSAVITESLRGAFQSEPSGAGKSSVTVSSFIGNRPEKWKTGLPAFDRLDFGEVYEGISLLLSARGNNVEKIFVLSPGADPREIAFGFEGASGIKIMPDGKLELQTALGAVYFTRPVAWQVEAQVHGSPFTVQGSREDCKACSPSAWVVAGGDDPDPARLGGAFGEAWASPRPATVKSCPLCGPNSTPIEVAYALDEDGTVRFELSSYDPNKILVIDPLLASTFIGGGGADAVQAIVVDSQTNIYVAGYTDSSDFPVTSGSPADGQDAFVSKFDANLGSLSASTYLGGSSNDQATAIGIDSGSRIWLAGYTESTNFPTPSSPMCTTNNGGCDAFVAILSSSLTLNQATYLGGTNLDRATAIAMNNLSSNQYVVGYTASANFPVTNSTGYRTNYDGEGDAFIVLFSNSVSRADYMTGIFLGGTNADEATGVMVAPGTSPTNFVFVVGFTSSTNYPSTNGYQRVYGGGSSDAFISRLSALLTNLPSSTFLGGTGSDVAYAVALDASNKLYVAGYTDSTNFPRNITNQYLVGWTNEWRGGQDIFVTCLTNNLKNLYASTYIGGYGDDVAKCLVVDSSSTTNLEYVYLAGYTASSDFPTTPNAYNRYYNGGGDAFVLRFDGRLTNMYASTYLGGVSNDQALALALGPESNLLFVAGITASDNFPSSDVAYQNVFGGGANDGFVTKFPASLAYGTLKWKNVVGYFCSSPALTWDGTVVVGASTSLIAFTRSGTERWRTNIISTVASYADGFSGLGTPAVGTNDVIYVNTQSGKVYAISSDKTFRGTYQSGDLEDYWSSVAIGNEGNIFFNKGSTFHANRQNCGGIWTNNLADVSWSSPAISSNGIIYAARFANPVLYAFSNTFSTVGSTSHVWKMGGVGGNMFSSPALGSNGIIYAMASNILYAFSPDGSTSWSQTVGSDSLSYSSPSIGSNGTIYVGAGNSLYTFGRFHGSAGTIWNAGGAVKSSPAISADGSIIVGATNGLYSFNPDGTTNWFFDTDDDIHFQAPLIDSEGTIYFSDDGLIYAIYGPASPAESGWPMFRHDALRTGNQGMDVANFLKPTGLSVSHGTFINYVHASWNASANAISYEVWRSTNNSTVGATRIRRLPQTNSCNDSSVDPGRIYYYWLKVKTPIALSVFSELDSGGIPPPSPTGVTASDGVPTNYVQVTWQASINATTYYVYRSTNDNTATAGDPIGLSSSTNYGDYTVAPGPRHYYWVKAGNGNAGISDFSSPSASGGIPCWAPAGFSASQGDYVRSVALSWNVSTGASSYLVFRNTENNTGSAGIIFTNIVGLGTNDPSGTPMRRYYYWLKATNEYGLSDFSVSAPGWSLLAPPLSVSASAGTYSNMIRVSWLAGSTDATAHVIFRSESSNPSTAVQQSEVVYIFNTDTNYDDTAITRGMNYYYWVAAKNNYGSSIWTAASAPGGTIPETPFDLNASDGTDSNMVQVTWTPSAGATSYTVFRNVTYNSAEAVVIGSAPTNYYGDSDAVHGVLYYYWVKAGNRFGLSSLSTFNSGWRGLTPPDNVMATDGSSTSKVTVSWSVALDATLYELWRGTSANIVSANKLVNNVSGVYYDDSSANPGTVYYYWVKAKRGAYSSVFSSSDFGYMAIGLLDIGISDFVFVPTVFGPPAHPSAVSFNVANLSGNDMGDPNNTLQYDLYISTNAVFGDGDDYRIGGTNLTLSLSAGASTRVTLSQTVREIITIPDWATSNYYVFVFVNHCLPSAWLDPNLANNVSRRTGNSISIASATAFQPVWNDYDGDGKSDFALYNPLTGSGQAGSWLFWLSASVYAQVSATGLGGTTYRAVPRDYDGDGKFDPAVYQSATGGWRVWLSGSGYQTISVTGLGGSGQYPVPADYDGDGRVDPAVYHEASGTWRGWMSDSGYAEVNASGIGGSGWRPAPADYDGDGHADPAVYHDSTGTWRVWLSGSGYQEAYVINWGGSGQRPVPADYDADGKIDPAVYQEDPSAGSGQAGIWRVWPSGSGYQENSVAGCGGSGQTAVPGDYDGDGRVDLVIYWQSMGFWRLWLSSYGYSEIDILMSGGEGFSAITFGE